MKRSILILVLCLIPSLLFSFHFSKYTSGGRLSTDSITALEFNDGTLYAGTREGLFIFNPLTRNFKHLNKDSGLASNYVAALSFNRKYNYLVIATGGGITLYQNGILKNYSAEEGLLNNDVRNIYSDSISGDVFVSCYGGGINRFNSPQISGIQLENYMTGGGMIENISSICVSDFYRDFQNRIWHATNGSGYHILSGSDWITFNTNPLCNQWITGLDSDPDGKGMIVSTTNGLFLLNNSDPDDVSEIAELKNKWIHSIATDQNALFMASREGLLLWSDKKLSNLSTSGQIDTVNVNLVIARDSAIIIGTEDQGVYIMNYPVPVQDVVMAPAQEDFDRKTILLYCDEANDIPLAVAVCSEMGLVLLEKDLDLKSICMMLPEGVEWEELEENLFNKLDSLDTLTGQVEIGKNHAVGAAFNSSDPFYKNTQSIYLNQTQYEQAMDEFQDLNSENVVVAVLDTGVDSSHTELKSHLLKGRNFARGSSTQDGHGHGTHCAGIIGATSNNSRGIAGTASNISILPVKCLGDNGSGTMWGVGMAIKYAADQGADIISMSLGGSGDSLITRKACEYAWEKGSLIIAAAGNSSTDAPHYPGSYPTVIGVSSVDSEGELSFFSNYGNQVDIAAPGEDIISTYKNNQYASMSGTSMACPHVAGLAGLVKSINPELTNKQLSSILLSSTQSDSEEQEYREVVSVIPVRVGRGYRWIRKVLRIPVGSSKSAISETAPNWTNQKGFGIINIYQAMKMASDGTEGTVDFIQEKETRLKSGKNKTARRKTAKR